MLNRQSSSTKYIGPVRKERARRIWVIVFGFLCTLACGILLAIVLRRVVGILGTPLLRTRAVLSETELLTATREELIAIIATLRAERDSAIGDELEYVVAIRENERLRELLGARKPEETFSVLASVIVRPPDTPYGLMVLDRGTREGVRVGDLVRSSTTEYLGTVVAVDDTSAKVSLFSAPDVETPIVLGADEYPLTAHGFGGSWRLEIPQEYVIEVGDVLRSADTDRRLLGVVVVVDDVPSEPFIYAYAAPRVNIQELTWVDIVRYE